MGHQTVTYKAYRSAFNYVSVTSKRHACFSEPAKLWGASCSSAKSEESYGCFAVIGRLLLAVLLSKCRGLYEWKILVIVRLHWKQFTANSCVSSYSFNDISSAAVWFMTKYHKTVTSKKWCKMYWSEWEMCNSPPSVF